MAEEEEREEDIFKKFQDAIPAIESLEQAASLRRDIDASPLPEGRKTYLKSILARREGEIGELDKIYNARVAEFIKRLDADERLKGILEKYFLVIAKHNCPTYSTLFANVLPYVGDFIEYVREKKGKTITAYDFDLDNLKDDDLVAFYNKPRWIKGKLGPWSETTQKRANSFIQVFGKWLARNKYVGTFPYVKITVEERIDSILADKRTEGKPRKLDELDRIMAVIGTERYLKEKWRAPVFKYFALIELNSGARPGQLMLALRFKDLLTGDTIIDVKGDHYIVIPYADALRREKIKRAEKVRKKKPMPDIFLHVDYAKEIIAYKDKMRWDEEVRVFPQTLEGEGMLPMRSIQHRMSAIADLSMVKDFVAYDFRHTWASILFNITGRDERSVEFLAKYGGWSSAEVPRRNYIELMTPTMALEIATKYKIFIPTEAEDDYEALKIGVKKVTVEDTAKVMQKLAEYDRLFEDLRRRGVL